MPQEATSWHTLSVEQAMAELNTNPDGLSDRDAKLRLQQFGPNALKEERKIPRSVVFLTQFRNPLIYILLIASILSFIGEHPVDGSVILAVVTLNAVIGFLQEHRAEKALEALKKLSALHATVARSGEEIDIDTAELVPGDIVVLDVGDKVPADCRLFEAVNMQVDESALTGESLPVSKGIEPMPIITALADRSNMIYSGTTVTYGRGMAIVAATGMSTEIGRIASAVAAEPSQLTPVQRKLSSLASYLGIIGLLVAIAIMIAGFARHLPLLDLFFLGVAAAVSFIPEGLPAVITVVLAIGVQRMAKNCAVIRKLPAVETLGSATVICSDKTGTLTKNEMTVRAAYTGTEAFSVSGEGYAPEGAFFMHGMKVAAESHTDLDALMTALVLCNDSRLHREDSSWRIIGDPTEAALVVAGEKLGFKKHDLSIVQPRVDEIPFDSQIRYMATLHELPDGRKVAYVKGAPERVLGMCDRYLRDAREAPLTADISEGFAAQNASMAADALRMLAAAYKEFPSETCEIEHHDVASGLTFLGAVGMMDPPREEAKLAIQAAHRAGIRVIMITGDHADTARTVAEILGLLESGMRVVPGHTLDAMTDAQLIASIGRIAVFARAEPEHKLRIIRALKTRGEIVAMTGDGVNDAPALKLADIGIAMGITGTDVAKEASHMILLNDNFATIVNAIEEGRNIFATIRRVTLYLLATNTGEVLIYLSTLLSGLPIPLLPVQILWVNLVTDGFSTIPLAMEPREAGILLEPPRNPNAPIVDRSMLLRMLFIAGFMLAGTLGLYYWGLMHIPIEKARTYAFVTIVFFQVFNVFNIRSSRCSIFSIGFLSNPYVLAGAAASVIAQILAVHTPFFQSIFRTVPLSPAEWILCAGVASTVFWAEEIRKRFISNRRNEESK